MSLLRPQIIDARGTRLALLAPLNPHDRRQRQRLQRALDARRIWTRRHILMSIAVIAPMALLAALMIPAMAFADRAPPSLVFFATAPAGMAVPMATLLLERQLHSAAYRDAYLSIGVCPSCGYDIGTATHEEDGCHLCPECGGAWRMA